MIRYLCNDYLEIIHVHSYSLASWNKELFGCIAQLIGLICGCCWWDGEKRTQMKILFAREETACDHVQDLIRIIDYKPLYKQIKPVRSNEETSLIDSTFVLLVIIAQTQNINWLFRSNPTIRDTIIRATATVLNDKVRLYGYGILGEVLADGDLKDLKIADHITAHFFYMAEQAWHHPLKLYNRIPLAYLLRGKCTDR
jgi:hypothetical protein